MKTRIALHLALLASAVAVFTATAIAKFSGEDTPSNQDQPSTGITLSAP